MRSPNCTTCVARAVAGVAGSSLILAASSAIAQQHHYPPKIRPSMSGFIPLDDARQTHRAMLQQPRLFAGKI